MNLVQINERLKDLPMQVIQQYANGMNPEVPPYLALGELQRRESSQKQAATAQGGQQGPQPSIKEQVEQKAGLMALQQMQQQQMAQQMQQPRGTMPVPPGAPQPEAQPQPEMMARGGLAGIPVRRDMFEYAGGGIIAFAEGGQSKKYETRYDKMNRENRERAAQNEPRVINLPPGTPDQEVEMIRLQNPDAIVQTGEEGGKLQALMDKIKGAATYSSDAEAMKQRERVASTPPASVSEAQASAMAGQQAQIPAAPPAGLPAALQKAGPAAATARPPASPMAGAPMPSAPRPAPAQAGASVAAQAGLPAALAGSTAAATSSNPYEARLNQVALKEPVAPTAQDAISRVNELSPAAMQEAALQKRNQEMRDRAASYKDQFEKSQPNGLDNLIRVLGQAGQYKGFSGIGPAYTANKQQQRAEELAMTKQYNELMNLADTKELEGGKELFKARTGAFDTAQQLFGKEKDNVVKAAASLYETTQSRINNELKLLSDKEIKMLEIAQRERERKSQNARDPNAMIAEYAGLKAKARELMELGGAENIKKANSLFARAEDMKEYGGKGLSSGSANADKQELAELKTLLKNAEDTAGNFALPKAARDEAVRRMSEINNQIASMTKLGSGTTSAPSGKVPAVGTVMDGYRFKGGNPANQSNWEKV